MRSWGREVLASVLVNSIYEMRNYPVVLLNTVLAPLSFLIVITFVSKGQLIGEAIEGGFIMSMFQSGMSLQGDLSHLKNDFKLQDMVVSSPTTPGAYVTGMALGEIIYSLPALAVLTVLAAVYIHPGIVESFELLGVFLLMFLGSVAMGFTLSTFSSDIVQSFAFSRLISTVFATLPPVYYPITYIPLPFRYAAYLSPTTYAAELAQSTTGLVQLSTTEIFAAWTILIAVSLLLFLVAAKKARWRDP
ncbi:MAG TPA: ABC transporter permease [Nitrososphaerales archaeon]|nr:ABC transporter permease [Nitrososphaerales archaeon]